MSGQLDPDITYIYERVNDVIYRRKAGTTERQEVSRDYDLRESIAEATLWGNIRRKAKTHPGLQAELERVILFYKLLEQK